MFEEVGVALAPAGVVEAFVFFFGFDDVGGGAAWILAEHAFEYIGAEQEVLLVVVEAALGAFVRVGGEALRGLGEGLEEGLEAPELVGGLFGGFAECGLQGLCGLLDKLGGVEWGGGAVGHGQGRFCC